MPPQDSVAAPPAAVAPDSTDGRGWAARGRAYLAQLIADRNEQPRRDTVWTRAVLDSADQALAQAAAALGAPGVSPEGDSARVLRVQVWSERTLLAWEGGGIARGADFWGPVPADLRLSPVLEELEKTCCGPVPRAEYC